MSGSRVKAINKFTRANLGLLVIFFGIPFKPRQEDVIDKLGIASRKVKNYYRKYKQLPKLEITR